MIFSFFYHRTCVYQRHTQKRQNIKTTSESIPIPKYVFSKNKNKNYLKPQVQRLVKSVDFWREKKVLQCKNALTAIPKILLFSAFRYKNTPTVSHQTIHLLCEKNEKIQKITIFPSPTEVATAFSIKTKITGKVKSHCLELIKICYFPDLFQLLCEKNEKIQTISIFFIANRGNSSVLKKKQQLRRMLNHTV